MLLSTILAAVSLTTPLLAAQREPRLARAEDNTCAAPRTFTHIGESAEAHMDEIIIDDITSGQACCKICHNDHLDCLIAWWSPEDNKCHIGINKSAKPNEGDPTEQCPSGALERGEIQNEVHVWYVEKELARMVGPCWHPVSGGKWSYEEEQREGGMF